MVMWLRQISVDNRAASRAAYYALGGMKILARFVRRELRLQAGKYGHCAVYEDELQRIWPINETNRKAKIEQFAKAHGFKLSFYRKGLCAIFEEDAAKKPKN